MRRVSPICPWCLVRQLDAFALDIHLRFKCPVLRANLLAEPEAGEVV